MTQSAELYARAINIIPGGVNSPVRAFGGVGGNPLFFKGGEGAYLTDVDHKRYIDYVGSWGPLILGHAHPSVVTAVKNAAENGLSFGASTEIEIKIAKKISTLMPSIEKIRMVNSGTEACMSAIRLARGYTKRNKIIKFIGCYHGHTDSLLVQAGSGGATFNVPNSAGVPQSFTEHTLLADFNDLSQVAKLYEEHGKDIAAIIVEPVAGNMGLVEPAPEFLQGLRDFCTHNGSVLIFDEVMTGFRVALGGAQERYGITPDLTTLAKVIGGGMPVGAFGGRANIMNHLAPDGDVYQAGTLSGNPVAMAAGLAQLNLISEEGYFERLETSTTILAEAIKDLAAESNIPLQVPHVGSMFCLFFTENQDIRNFDDVKACDEKRFQAFFHALLSEGVYIAPSAFESAFMSSAHGPFEIEQTLISMERAFKSL